MSVDPRTLDLDARRRAQSCFDKPLLVEAGAGTGKTATLVYRIVTWLLTEGWSEAARSLEDDDRIAARALSRCVAITFTDAAAAEMAGRVELALAALGRGDLECLEGFQLDLLPLAEDERARRARALIGGLDRLVVRTIHAWCRLLLARYPVEAGLGASFDVDADGSIAETAAREALEAALPGIYADEALRRDAVRLARQKIGPEQLAAALVELSTAALDPAELDRDPCAPSTVEALHALLSPSLEALLTGFSAPAERLAKLTRVTIESLEELRELASALARPRTCPRTWLDELSAALSALEQAPGRVSEWAKDGALKPTDAKQLGPEACAAIVAAATSLGPALARLKKFDIEDFEARRRVLRTVYGSMRERIRRAGALTYGELLREVDALLASHPEVLNSVRGEIGHLLVDEFQDTDALQCSIVRRLALGEGEDGPSLFVVGDPKQSIYSWREADLASYDDFKDEIERAGGAVEQLFVNFRSTTQILEEVTRVVRPLMKERRGIQPVFQELVAGKDEREGPAVEHWVPWIDSGGEGKERDKTLAGDANALEARGIARELAAAHAANEALGRRAILLRSMTGLDPLLDALRDAGVPHVVAKDRNYYRRREIIDAAALVRCIADPGDAIALLTWMRSSAVGTPDAALPHLWASGFPSAAALLGTGGDALERAHAIVDEAAAALTGEDQAALGLDRVPGWHHLLRNAIETLAELRHSFERDDADVFVETLRRASLLELGEAGRHLAPFRIANLERFFLELAKTLDESRGDSQALARALRTAVSASRDAEEARPEGFAANAVQILSMHASKGLDFDTVYLPQLHRGSSGSRGRDESSHAKLRPEGWEIKLLGAYNPLSYLYTAHDARVEEAEKIRLLYVAMTRARVRLVLSGTWSLKASSTPTMVQRLLRRETGVPDLHALFDDALQSGGTPVESHDAFWRFPFAELHGEEQDHRAPPPRAPLDRDALLGAVDALATRRVEAAETMSRRLGAPISGLSHEAFREERVDGREEGGTPPDLARLVGTFVHKIMELVDLSQPLLEGLDDAVRRARAHLPSMGGRASLSDAIALTRDLLEALSEGEIPARFDALREHVLARELDVIATPQVAGVDAHAFAAGKIDLVYRDPETGGIVVADYKTDNLDAESARETYAPQLQAYARALKAAWNLEELPRTELWLLREGVVTPCRD